MKKKIVVMGIVLIMLCSVVAVVFAEAEISFTTSSVTVTNTEKNTKIPIVEVCVTIQERSGRKVDKTFTFYDVTDKGKTKKVDAGEKILAAYFTYCAVPEPEK